MTQHKRTSAPLLLALALVPSLFAACNSGNSAPIPSGDALTCADGATGYKTAGRLTLSTNDPGTPPWWGGDPNVETSNMPAGQSGWTVGNPYAMEGFEGGVAYSLANSLGFEPDHVDWVENNNGDVLAGSAKNFDFHIAQVAKTEATDAVDLSDPYYTTEEAVVTLNGRSVATANSVAALVTYKLGAVAASAGAALVTTVIKPSAPVTTFPDLTGAIAGLKDGTVDALIVNVHVALYMRDSWIEGDDGPAPLPEAIIVGRFASSVWSDDYVVVLPKGSALTACVNQAVDEITRQGLVDEYKSEYITSSDQIPTLQ